MPGSDVLPGNIIVTEYEIHIKPCLDTFKFEGSSRIHLTVVEATTIIKLHAKELAFEPKVVLGDSWWGTIGGLRLFLPHLVVSLSRLFL